MKKNAKKMAFMFAYLVIGAALVLVLFGAFGLGPLCTKNIFGCGSLTILLLGLLMTVLDENKFEKTIYILGLVINIMITFAGLIIFTETLLKEFFLINIPSFISLDPINFWGGIFFGVIVMAAGTFFGYLMQSVIKEINRKKLESLEKN